MFRGAAGEGEHYVREQEEPEQSMVVCGYKVPLQIRNWGHLVAGRLRGASARGSKGRRWDAITEFVQSMIGSRKFKWSSFPECEFRRKQQRRGSSQNTFKRVVCKLWMVAFARKAGYYYYYYCGSSWVGMILL